MSTDTQTANLTIPLGRAMYAEDGEWHDWITRAIERQFPRHVVRVDERAKAVSVTPPSWNEPVRYFRVENECIPIPALPGAVIVEEDTWLLVPVNYAGEDVSA
ncbi:MAG TPA: hypothetical protein VNM48_02605 [Chloroflexota bacterium]|nr:hypothetical protein [Chloroflexota bacterium]